LDLYYEMSLINGFASGGSGSISYFGAISSDEAVNVLASTTAIEFFENAILPDNSRLLSLWSQLYKTIYKANAILEGLEANGKVTDARKLQYEGEARFIRAFCHFYLLNLFGEIPLVLTTDYNTNQTIGRTSTDQVYQQVVEDLKTAQQLLAEDYSFSNGERIQANKSVATAMLSRVYLYMEDWPDAETQATAVINNANLYSLTPLDEVFLKNSKETLLQLPPRTGNVYDRSMARSYTRLQESLVADFEAGDQRLSRWVTSGNVANKYRSGDNSSSEYSMVLRLAEQYLIRGEARAHQDNISGATEDINVIRSRAGLGETNATDQATCLSVIEHERRLELFLEWAHRWLDLKRTKRMNEVLPAVKPFWKETARLFPIPEAQIMNDPTMKDSQNDGY
jgi:hypothetical protein